MSTHDSVKTLLQEKLDQLLRRVEKIEGDLKSTHDLTQVQQTREALQRIDSGSYGICSTCGQPISEERLAALPTTVTCMNCATSS